MSRAQTIIRAPYFHRDGTQTTRGYRAFCAPCGYLALGPMSYDQARRAMTAHRKTCPKREKT